MEEDDGYRQTEGEEDRERRGTWSKATRRRKEKDEGGRGGKDFWCAYERQSEIEGVINMGIGGV